MGARARGRQVSPSLEARTSSCAVRVSAPTGSRVRVYRSRYGAGLAPSYGSGAKGYWEAAATTASYSPPRASPLWKRDDDAGEGYRSLADRNVRSSAPDYDRARKPALDKRARPPISACLSAVIQMRARQRSRATMKPAGTTASQRTLEFVFRRPFCRWALIPALVTSASQKKAPNLGWGANRTARGP